MLYSIVISYNEDTYVIQQVGDSPNKAIYAGLKNHGSEGIRIFNSNEFTELIVEIENRSDEVPCVALNELLGVWGTTFLVEDRLVQIYAIETHQNI